MRHQITYHFAGSISAQCTHIHNAHTGKNQSDFSAIDFPFNELTALCNVSDIETIFILLK